MNDWRRPWTFHLSRISSNIAQINIISPVCNFLLISVDRILFPFLSVFPWALVYFFVCRSAEADSFSHQRRTCLFFTFRSNLLLSFAFWFFLKPLPDATTWSTCSIFSELWISKREATWFPILSLLVIVQKALVSVSIFLPIKWFRSNADGWLSVFFLSLRTFCRLEFSYHFSVVLSLPVNPCGRLRLRRTRLFLFSCVCSLMVTVVLPMIFPVLNALNDCQNWRGSKFGWLNDSIMI